MKTNNKNIAVLLIKASPQVRESVNKMLSSNGYTVTNMSDCDEALPMVKVVAFDIVLCCSSPSSMTCAEFAQRAKAIQPSLKVIVATSKEEHPSLDKSESVDEILHKPFFISKLFSLIENLLK